MHFTATPPSAASNRPRRSTAALRVRRLLPAHLSRAEVEHWERLSDHSLSPNPFLSPHFTLPLLQHLPPDLPVRMLVVEDEASGEWRAAGVFEITSPSMRQPLAYAQGLSSSYAFLDGLLIDRRDAARTVQAMFYDQFQHRDWHGFHFSAIHTNSPLDRLLHFTAQKLGMSIFYPRRWDRAQFSTHQSISKEEIVQQCSKSRRKSLRRGRRLLDDQGNVTFQLRRATGGSDSCVDGFLRLEAMGWKGAQGTAIACSPPREAFFRNLVENFSQKRDVLFGELRLDNQLIASTCNIRSAETLTAFKIGWDPSFADAGIGLWSEIELAAAVCQNLPEIAYIDSSAKEGSYVESVWLDRQPMHSVTYSWSRRGCALQSARQYYYWLKRLMPQSQLTH
ncbi:MAG: GNAT family N-acetyltransferase [Planctomycetaceae bacterium]|nr:GNAT family N-acetyltransferase [Planctomycetaceae bacterium]